MSDYSTILVLGNGFDIEHGLPTKYKDFCEYIDNLKESKAYELELQLASYYHEHIKRALGGKNNCLYNIITEKLTNWVPVTIKKLLQRSIVLITF